MKSTRLLFLCIAVLFNTRGAAQDENVYTKNEYEKVSYNNSVAGVYNFHIESRGKIELTDVSDFKAWFDGLH